MMQMNQKSKKNRRLSISMDDDLFDIISTISKSKGQSKAAFIREVMDMARPSLRYIADAVETVADIEDTERADLAAKLSRVQHVLEFLHESADNNIEDFHDILTSASGAASDARQGAEAAPEALALKESQPPYTNRGVRLTLRESKRRSAKP